jgi:hypothetical protein
MIERENFVSRWSRLKRESEAARKHDLPRSAPSSGDAGTNAGGEDQAATAGNGVACDEASLPAIDSIAAATDIRSFLRSGVPAELTRAALRRAWTSDPAIRDFIGIAENQWDFTDPTGIPGFGPLRDTDDVPGLLAQALGKLDEFSEASADIDAPAAQAPTATTDPRHGAVVEAPGNDPAATVSSAPRHGHARGSALPQ